ncbi:hypothetical protein BH11MYX1_BH11MYX1_54930 [soil metagenome]
MALRLGLAYIRGMPYRDRERSCPACQQPLRAYQTRLCCDACNGIMVTLDDLATAVNDLTSLTPDFEWAREHPGTRPCPECSETMTSCKLILRLDGHAEHPKPELDRCATHGLWFDHDELAAVFETIATKGFGGAVQHKSKSVERIADRGSWSAMFKYFGGRGGF